MRRPHRQLGLMMAIVATGLLHTAPALAFVCSRVKDGSGAETGPAVTWYTRRVPFTFFMGGSSELPGNDELAVVRYAFSRWAAARDCETPSGGTDLSFIETSPSNIDRIGYDYVHPEQNENLIVFRDDEWPIVETATETLALTTTTYVARTGELIDADVEFNTANFVFNTDGSPDQYDLLSVTMHELGHFVGLGHSTVPGSTMQRTASPGETEKATLECDDRNGIVFKYPAGGPNQYCDPPVAECGFCAPPSPLDSMTSVELTPIGSGCNGAAPSAPALPGLLLLLVGGGRRLVRRRLACRRDEGRL